MRFSSTTLCIAAAAGILTLGGCYESFEDNTPEAQYQGAGPDNSGGDWQQSSGSALGGAKRSAESTAGALEQRSQELADDIDNGEFSGD